MNTEDRVTQTQELMTGHLKKLQDLTLYVLAANILVVGLMFGIGGVWLQIAGLVVVYLLGLVSGVTVFVGLGLQGIKKAREVEKNDAKD